MWGGSGKMPEAWYAASNKLQWVNSFSAGVNPLWMGLFLNYPFA